jgi:hypothetical protein
VESAKPNRRGNNNAHNRFIKKKKKKKKEKKKLDVVGWKDAKPNRKAHRNTPLHLSLSSIQPIADYHLTDV